MSTPASLALYLPDGRIQPPENPYGRHVANAGVYRALARSGHWERITVLCQGTADPEQLARDLGIDSTGSRVTTGPLLGVAAATEAGTLLSGQPYLSQPAWARRHGGRDADYSIVGTVFAFSSPTHRELMLHSLLAPLHPWDALICSSPTLQRTVTTTLDAWQEHLRERLGRAASLPRPALPVIPFGCDVASQTARSLDRAARVELRAELGLSDETVMALYLGRLSYVDKAFPQAMLKALQLASATVDVPVHFVMAGWFPDGDADRARFDQAILRHCPDVTVTILDGNDQGLVARCWAAADLFLQLSDSIIETFGQAVVEAMSAGLPVVVSDWDGFRSIVREGVDGFLVPTLGAAPGPLGETLALLQYVDAVGYGSYSGAVAQHTAVDIEAAAAALVQLMESAPLRRTMGDAGRRRAREVFDWPIVVDQYVALFAELAERRAAGAASGGMRLNPLRSDPFADFAALPTEVLTDDLVVECTERDLPDPAVELDVLYPGVRGTDAEARRIVEILRSRGAMTVRELLAEFPVGRRARVRMSVSWLAKSGTLRWR